MMDGCLSKSRLFLLVLLFPLDHLVTSFAPLPGRSQSHPTAFTGSFLNEFYSGLWHKRPDHNHFRLFQQALENRDEFARNEQKNSDIYQSKTQSLVRAALNIEPTKTLVPIRLVGTVELPTASSTDTRLCLVLAEDKGGSSAGNAQPCLLVPLIRDGYLKPIEAAYTGLPLSEPDLLRLNANLVNRDQSLWDNLPWPLWTIDPNEQNRDAARNFIDPKFHMGKRDAYNVMLGKDWYTFQSSSRAVSFLADQLRSIVNSKGSEAQESSEENSNDDDHVDEKNRNVLAQRLLEFQIREVEMDIAELDYQLAIARLTNPDQVGTLEFEREEILVGLEAFNEQLQELTTQEQQTEREDSSASTNAATLMQRILNLVDKREPAPYRGATGYAPYQGGDDISSKEFTSSFEMLVNIVENQLQADVVGCVLENTSLLDGTTVIGAAVVLRRKTARKDVSIMGTKYIVDDEEEDFGNTGIQGGETYVVECEADEALGLCLACPNVPLQIETELWQPSIIVAELSKDEDDVAKSRGAVLPTWKVLDTELSVLLEGQARNNSVTERVAPIRVPRTTVSLYDSMISQLSRSGDTPADEKDMELFPTDNPVRSLTQLDNMNDQDKAATLLSMSNFQGRLPRPRVVRQAKAMKGDAMNNPLDELLLPLIDESVRRQYLIREAKERGDTDLVRELESAKSSRQKAWNQRKMHVLWVRNQPRVDGIKKLISTEVYEPT